MVTRAGATTISEIISYKVPSILVPSPYVTDNHQYKNAKSLVDKDAALLIEEKDLNENLVDVVENTLNDKEIIKKMKSNLSMMSINDSASKMYDLISKVVNGR